MQRAAFLLNAPAPCLLFILEKLNDTLFVFVCVCVSLFVCAAQRARLAEL